MLPFFHYAGLSADVFSSYRGAGRSALLNTGLIDFAPAAQGPGWLALMRGDEGTEKKAHGTSSFAFRRDHPLHAWELVLTGQNMKRGLMAGILERARLMPEEWAAREDDQPA